MIAFGKAAFARAALSPDDIIVDPNATCLEDARWVGRVIYADYDAVMHDDRFRNKSRLQPTAVMVGATANATTAGRIRSSTRRGVRRSSQARETYRSSINTSNFSRSLNVSPTELGT
jgi:hypothetical protein